MARAPHEARTHAIKTRRAGLSIRQRPNFPIGWWHWLTRPSKINQIRVFTLGVRQKYQNLPLGAPLYKRTWDAGREAGIKGAECSWVLEDNHKMRSAIEKMGGKIYKTYRIYERWLAPEAVT